MAFLRVHPPVCSFVSIFKFAYINCMCQSSINGRNCLNALSKTNNLPFQTLKLGVRASSTKTETPEGSVEVCSTTECAVTSEIKFYRDLRNHFSQMCFSDSKEPYGPPLAILLPWTSPGGHLLKKFIDFYGEKGFDVLTVTLKKEQLLYPCVAGNAMNVVTELLEYLNEMHRYRPYVFHGFSVGAYVYGEVLAQFADQYEIHRGIMNNVKGCLWDSPVDFLTVKQYAGKFFYPRNCIKRFMCNRSVRRHFKKNYHDSVVYWLRARENFCNPIIKVPNVFFMSYTDMLSNPCSLQTVQKTLECNGIPIFQKTWWDSAHGLHFEKYCYEYTYGMILFFNLSNLFPDDCGKYRSSASTASLANLRLSKTARDNFCSQCS